MVKGLVNSSSNKIIISDEQEVAPSKQNVRAACPNLDKLEFKFFGGPVYAVLVKSN